MSVTRRQFLKTSAVVVPAAALMPTVFADAVAAAVSEKSPAPLGVRTLVVVQMAGGNDGLNTVVAANNNRYYDLRPNVRIDEQSVLSIDRDRGLHPSMSGMKELWDEGSLAIVEGVGYPNQSYSHFQSMDIWQTGDVEGRGLQIYDGWLGRYLAGVRLSQAEVMGSFCVGKRLPRALLSDKVSVPMVDKVANYRFLNNKRDSWTLEDRTAALVSLYGSAPNSLRFGAVLDDTFDAANRSANAIQSAHNSYNSQVVYPTTKLGQALKQVAEAIDANLGIRIAHVRIGGFDTHASQLPEHADLLRQTSDAVTAFYRDLQAHNNDTQVVIMTWSEFGRRATNNASGGSDHGSAGPMFIAGTPVKGGLYGEPCNLSKLDKNNLRFTTDFRSVYSTVLGKWLGAPAELVLGSNYEALDFIKTEAVAA